VTSYSRQMLPALRDARGKPAAPLRLLAVLVVLGLIVPVAPLIVDVLRWVTGLLV
jgi:hypothetical protein